MIAENANAVDTIVSQIIAAINKKIVNLQYDKTFPSVVYGITEDGNYKIAFEGKLRTVTSALSEKLKVGQWVWVKIPSGSLRNMHICGIRKEK